MLKFLVVLALLVGVVVIYPSPIESMAFQPSRPLDMVGILAPNDSLQSTQLTVFSSAGRGGEDVAVDKLKCVYTGVDNGNILRKCPYSTWETLINTGGRPLGLAFDSEQNLIIADGVKGLLRLTPANHLDVLVDQFQGQPLGVANDVDIAADGTIYFSDASSRFPLKDYLLDAFDARPSGRLFSYQPESKQLKLLADDLFFANGVAVSDDQSFVLVNESFSYQIIRIWLTGEKAGSREVFINKLPGIPDGIARDQDGSFWLALYSPRSQLLDTIHPFPWLKDLVAKLPQHMAPRPKPYGFVVQLDQAGNIIHSLHDQAGVAIGEITSVQPEDDGLYFGTLHGNSVGKLAY
jgi:sugar lactone lactonase YvrE